MHPVTPTELNNIVMPAAERLARVMRARYPQDVTSTADDFCQCVRGRWLLADDVYLAHGVVIIGGAVKPLWAAGQYFVTELMFSAGRAGCDSSAVPKDLITFARRAKLSGVISGDIAAGGMNKHLITAGFKRLLGAHAQFVWHNTLVRR